MPERFPLREKSGDFPIKNAKTNAIRFRNRKLRRIFDQPLEAADPDTRQQIVDWPVARNPIQGRPSY